MPESKVMELAAMRVPLLSALVDKVDVVSTRILSNNSHCCMSLVISWKDTTCGCRIDKFRITSVASNGSLEGSTMRVKIAHNKKKYKALLRIGFDSYLYVCTEIYLLYFDYIAVMQYISRAEVYHCYCLFVIINGSYFVIYGRRSTQSEATQPFECTSEECWLLCG